MFSKFFSSLLVVVLTATICVASAGREGTVSGKWITKEYGPMTGGQVLFFNVANGPAPAGSKFLRLPDAGVPIDEDGKFSAELPAGKYYLVMRKRANPESAGPPQEGDPQFYSRLKNGEAKTYVVKAGRTTNIGTVTAFVPYKREKIVAREGMTGIEGIVTDDQRQPVSGVRVLAYDSAGMVGRPMYASDETGTDGKYFLIVAQSGNYYLKVRTHYGGGKPAEGEFMGNYGKQGKAEPVAVEKGKITKGINVEGSKFTSKSR